MQQLPTHYTLVAGSGSAPTPLMAFDEALKEAGIAQYNLVRVSSILPPGGRETARVDLPHGSLLPIAYGRAGSQEPGMRVTAGVGIGLPAERERVGVIVECHGELEPVAARRLLTQMLADAMRRRGSRLRQAEVRVSTARVESGAACAFAGAALWSPLD